MVATNVCFCSNLYISVFLDRVQTYYTSAQSETCVVSGVRLPSVVDLLSQENLIP